MKIKPSKNKKGAKNRKKQKSPINVDAAKILRTVRSHEAFYFYEAVGKPTGEIAVNLPEFLDKVKSVASVSLSFHLQRRDFQNWVEKILGDSELAEKLGRISSTSNDDIRMNILKAVENRIRELRESSLEVQVDDASAVIMSAI